MKAVLVVANADVRPINPSKARGEWNGTANGPDTGFWTVHSGEGATRVPFAQ